MLYPFLKKDKCSLWQKRGVCGCTRHMRANMALILLLQCFDDWNNVHYIICAIESCMQRGIPLGLTAGHQSPKCDFRASAKASGGFVLWRTKQQNSFIHIHCIHAKNKINDKLFLGNNTTILKDISSVQELNRPIQLTG